ncbi:hypothetical protein M422DRAFT_248656 [Sphaerobolus stellatus SS14]|nr:hypothetical protein M422DRAFT_248656 [Sphaerobolus stellatus SS14]
MSSPTTSDPLFWGANAESKIKGLTMGDPGRAVHFFIHFIQYKACTQWSNCNYLTAYDGLPWCIKDKIAKMFQKPETYGSLHSAAIQLDQQYWEYKHETDCVKPHA